MAPQPPPSITQIKEDIHNNIVTNPPMPAGTMDWTNFIHVATCGNCRDRRRAYFRTSNLGQCPWPCFQHRALLRTTQRVEPTTDTWKYLGELQTPHGDSTIGTHRGARHGTTSCLTLVSSFFLFFSSSIGDVGDENDDDDDTNKRISRFLSKRAFSKRLPWQMQISTSFFTFYNISLVFCSRSSLSEQILSRLYKSKTKRCNIAVLVTLQQRLAE